MSDDQNLPHRTFATYAEAAIGLATALVDEEIGTDDDDSPDFEIKIKRTVRRSAAETRRWTVEIRCGNERARIAHNGRLTWL